MVATRKVENVNAIRIRNMKDSYFGLYPEPVESLLLVGDVMLSRG